jgi:hypothetical protein
MADETKEKKKFSVPGDPAFNAWHTQKRRKQRKEED